MLLPSALSCDSSQSQLSKNRYQSSLFASPPLSPPSSSSSSHPAISNLYSTCRALQSMLTTPSQLPSPPTIHSEPPLSPFKLRLRARKDDAGAAGTSRKRIAKRSPPRGINKRRRAADDEMGRDALDADAASGNEAAQRGEYEDTGAPRTPKRVRLAPEVLPLGLHLSDFHTLHLDKCAQSQADHQDAGRSLDAEGGTEQGREDDGGDDAWSTEEDRILVELVLEKLKLSKSEWQDCARSLGKDRGSVGKRWKSLMGAGDVGLKNRSRRAKIHGTWR